MRAIMVLCERGGWDGVEREEGSASGKGGRWGREEVGGWGGGKCGWREVLWGSKVKGSCDGGSVRGSTQREKGTHANMYRSGVNLERAGVSHQQLSGPMDPVSPWHLLTLS